MEYECDTAPLDRLPVGPTGLQEPLCNNCLAPDCSNPIREKTVSVMGVPRQWRFWTMNNIVLQVVRCKGYVGKDEVAESDEEY